MRGFSVDNRSKTGKHGKPKAPAVFIPLDTRKQEFAHLAARKKTND